MEATLKNLDVLFLLLGGAMILAMHAGFAFLEVGTVRHKNQVNALVKILADLSVSCVAYFFIGFMIAYGESFYEGAQELSADGGYSLTRFFFLFTFAAAIPAIISGGIAERMKFLPQLIANFIIDKIQPDKLKQFQALITLIFSVIHFQYIRFILN